MDSGDEAPRRSYTRGTRVYVGGLNDGIKKEDLEREFEKYGKLNNVWVAFNPPGFAFVEFDDEQEAESACDSLNGQDVMGVTMKVEISRGRGRGGRGGFRGRSFGGRSSYGGGRGDSRGGRGGYRGRSDYGGGSRGFRDDRGGGGKMRGSYDRYSSRDSGYSRDYDRDDKYGSRAGGDGYGSSDSYYKSSSSRSRDYSSGGYGGGRDSYSSRGRDSYGAPKDSYSSRNGDGYGSSRRSSPPRPRY